MKIISKKLHLHKFLSFEDSTINLQDRGFCVVSGVNKNPKDAAKSNGSGKSSIWNALCYVLTGETVDGLKSNLSNINFNDGCYVEFEFEVDGKNYRLIRSKDDTDENLGTNLKIFIDGEDKSGKGIRESQALLDEYLPDLTKELITSVIILGQGLPNRFTANSPAGRKELLEHLSKSDFMIQDIKDRLDNRSTVVAKQLQEKNNLVIKYSSELGIYSNQLEERQKDLDNLPDPNKLVDLCFDLQTELNIKKGLLERRKKDLEKLAIKKEAIKEDIRKETELKNNRLTSIYKQYIDFDKELAIKKNNIELNIKQTKDEISKLKSIKDICPTCGQKIPGVIKQDTSKQEALCESLSKDLEKVLEEIKINDSEYAEAQNEVENMFISTTTSNSKELADIEEAEKTNDITGLPEEIDKLKEDLIKAENDRKNIDSYAKNIEESIKNINKNISSISENLQLVNEEIASLNKHIDILNKMSTFVKRDFRGILLLNVINYIDKKAKEYALKIFNTDNIEFKLDGTAIDIIYCNKYYENLSGGEKQRVDIITQFAIRSMMSTYLDFSSNILVLDEITDNLDAVSCDRVINFIANELKDIESIFVISHHEEIIGDIADTRILIEKNSLGISSVV